MRDREAERGENTRGDRIRGFYSRSKDPRIWNREEYYRLEKDSFTVFVDNLPEDISRRELYQLFCWTGRINDIYLSRKQKNATIYLFAFVRYTTKGGALKAIAEMNHFRLRGKNISVAEAKFRRKFTAGDRRVNVEARREREREPEITLTDNEDRRELEREPRKTLAGTEAVIDPVAADRTSFKQGKGCMKRVEVPVVVENMDWLARSLVGYTLQPIDFRSLRRVITANLHHVEDVREIGETKVLVTFETVEHADAVHTFKMDTLLQVFHRVRRWEEAERCVSRSVWLECHGVPLHVWSPETFKMIGGLWGKVLQCDSPTGAGASFRVGKVQVETDEFANISDYVQLDVGGKEFRVFVEEMRLEAGGTGILVEGKKAPEGNATAGSCVHSTTTAGMQWDPAADLIIGNAQGGDTRKDRIVIPEVLLNDVNVEFLNFKNIDEATDSVSTTQNIGKVVTKEYGSEEEDSDRTVTEGFCAGEERDFAHNDISIGPLIGPLILGKQLSCQKGPYQEGSALGPNHLSPTPNHKGIGLRDWEDLQKGWGNESGPNLGWKGTNRVAATLDHDSRRVELVPPAASVTTGLVPDASTATDLVGVGVEVEGTRPITLAVSIGAADVSSAPVQSLVEGAEGSCETMMKAGMRVGTTDRLQGLTEVSGAEGSAALSLDRLRGTAMPLGANLGEGEAMQGLATTEGIVVDGAGSGTGGGQTIKGEEAKISKEAQVKENQVTWALAVESGAELYDEDVDIMSILQAQNEEIAQKRKLAKQKEKARRSRPKNKCKVSNSLIK